MASIDEYADTLSVADAAELRRIYGIAQAQVPGTEQGVSYAMPALMYRGKPLISVMVLKRHLSIYPFSGKVVDEVRERLEGYSLSSGAIRFTLEKPVPESLIKEIVAARLAEIAAA